jgi:hypothetical protein
VIGPTGEYVRTVKPEPRYLTAHFTGVFNDGGFMLANECCSPASFAYEPRRLTILRHEPNGRLADTLGVFPTSRMARRGLRTARAIGTPLFEPRTIVAAQNSNILVGDSRVMELKVIDGSGRLVRIIRWSGEQQQVTERDVEAYRRNLMAQARTGLDSSFVRMDTDPEIPVNSSFPAYQAIVISRALGVWVQQYGKPTDLRHQRWMVFDSVGRFGCNVELPPPFEVHEVGDSYVLGVEKDSLDVEEVRAYRIYSPQ